MSVSSVLIAALARVGQAELRFQGPNLIDLVTALLMNLIQLLEL